MYHSIKNLCAVVWSWIAALLSPPTCAGCGLFLDERVPLCDVCEQTIIPIVSAELIITRSYTMKVYALSEYTGIIRNLIMAKQWSTRVPSRQLGQLIVARCLLDWKCYDYIVPVPLHWRRYAQRGFNQSEEIARIIQEYHGIPVSCGVTRKRSTVYQTKLEQQARRMNVNDAFEVDATTRALYQGKHILIIDDVLTTGSTLSEVARIVSACRPASITAVVAARVILK